MQKRDRFSKFRQAVLIIVLAGLFVSCKKTKVNHTFIFDNRERAYKIETLALAGDFNGWNKNSIFMKDTNNNNIWRVTVPLSRGGHYYRFVLNNKQWLRDMSNPLYGGAYSNSFVFIDTTTYPFLTRLNPPNGSWLFIKPDSLRLFFNRPVSEKKLQILLSIDGQKQDFTLKDSVLSGSFPYLSEGRHFWKVQIKNTRRESVYEKNGIWQVNRKNQPPAAIAGYTQFAFAKDTVSLNGGLSFDADFEPLRAWRWQQTGGPLSVKLKHAATPFAQFCASLPGKYSFRLAVRDSAGAQATARAELLVLRRGKVFTEFRFDPAAYDGKIHSVALAGEFNLWDKNSNRLQPNADSTEWLVQMPLANGRYEYKYVINGRNWISDPGNPRKISDGWKGLNSIKDVGNSADIRPEFVLLPEQGDKAIRVLARVQGEAKTKLRWKADHRNPKAKIRLQGAKLYFSGNNPQGSYFFYCLPGKKDKSFAPRTLLINHYQKTVVKDFDAPPRWAERAVIYEIYLRRYGADGNFRSLRQSLPEIKKLGVNALWLMPVYEGPTEHGYAPTDLFSVAKSYGSLEEYRDFIEKAHGLGMKIIFDFVANHFSDQHVFVRAAVDNPASPFRKWFFWRPDGSWGYHNDWDTLVNLNYGSAQVRHHILNAARFWLSVGVDGFRCDAAWAVPHDFWKDFRREVKKINPECLLINEALPRRPAFHRREFDMSYDTDFYGNLMDVMNGRKPLSALPYGLQKTELNYPPTALSLRYLENQDLPRFIKQFGARRTRLAAVILFTVPGTPLVYYGQENGVTRQRPFYNLSRHTNWFDFYHSLIKFRLKNRALSGGKFKTLLADDEKKLWVYRRSSGDNEIQVTINLSKKSRAVNIPAQHTIVKLRGSAFRRLADKIVLAAESFLVSKKTQ